MDIEHLFQETDNFIFDAPYVGVQSLAFRVQYYSSLSPLDVARLLYVVFLIGPIWSNYRSFAMTGSLHHLWFIIMFLMLGGLGILLSYYAGKIGKPGMRNPLRARWNLVVHRQLLFWWSIMGVLLALVTHEWQILSALLLYVLGCYFVAADHLPPKDRYQWFRKRQTVPV